MKKKLSILIYSLASGGAERVVSTLLSELKNRYDISLVLMSQQIFYSVPREVNIVYLSNSKVGENGLRKLLKIPFLSYRYLEFCKKNRIDISLSFMNRPNYINTLSKIFGNTAKIYISERIAPSQEYLTNSVKDKISRYLIKNLYPIADLILPNAQGIKSDLEKNFNINQNMIKVINNSLDISGINKLKEKHLDFEDKFFTFITVGRFDYQKNHKLLLSAMQSINARLYIIGDGMLREELKRYVHNNNLVNKVVFLGKQKNPYSYISRADCFILPSNYEGFPNVLLEALSCGLPIISTDCRTGPREILAPATDYKKQLNSFIEVCEYGILTPVENLEKMKEAMLLIMHDDILKNNLKAKSIERAKMFSKEKIIKEWLEIL